jgi:hypothetical protein
LYLANAPPGESAALVVPPMLKGSGRYFAIWLPRKGLVSIFAKQIQLAAGFSL